MMIDLILIVFVGAVAVTFFWLGSKFKTWEGLKAGVKAKVREWLGKDGTPPPAGA